MSPDRRDDETPRNRAGRARSDDGAADDTADGARTDAIADSARTDAVAGTSEPSESTESDSRDTSEPTHDVRADEEFGPVGDTGPRDIVVPARLFKLVTVVTTLLAIPTVVLGFMFLDAATLQTNVARRTVLFVVSWLGLPIDESLVSILLGLVGVGLIAAGAGIYIVGSRFRAAGMGNAEDDTAEDSTNG